MAGRVHMAALCVGVAGTAGSTAMAQCADWLEQPNMRRPGVVRAVTTWDPDGAGPLGDWLVVAGEFERAQGVSFTNIAAWDGAQWHALDTGITNLHGYGVQSLAVYHGQLIAGGSFAAASGQGAFNIARWNGEAWQPMGDIFGGDAGTAGVKAMTVYNDELIVGGHFLTAGENSVRNIAKWNGFQWQPLGSGVNDALPYTAEVSALAVYNGQLYAGGHFSTAGGNACTNMARWDGSNWSAVAGGLGIASGVDRVNALTVHAGELVAGGRFSGACNNIAAFNGTSWHGVGAGICGVNDTVYAVASYGGSLYASGFFDRAGGNAASLVARFDGTAWNAMEDGLDAWGGVMGVYNNELYVGGYFFRAGDEEVEGLARWNGVEWLPTLGVTSEPYDTVMAMTPWAGKMVIGGSYFTSPPMGSPPGYTAQLAVWDGRRLTSIGHPNGTVRAMTTRTRADRTTDLIIVGDFTEIDGVPMNHIAILNDTRAGGWQTMPQEVQGSLYAVEVYGGRIYVGGSFFTNGTNPANNFASWNGSAWETPFLGVNGPVYALKNFQNRLFIGGAFTNGSGVFSAGVIGWNGSIFSSVEHGAFGPVVYALTVYDDALIIGGQFTGFNNSPNLGWYDGIFRGVFAGGTNAPVRSLAVSDGSLVVGGDFTVAGGAASDHLAKWTGILGFPTSGTWTSMPGATDGTVRALAAYAGELHVGGDFLSVRNGSLYMPYYARYSETGEPVISDQPDGAFPVCGGDAMFAVEVASGYDNLQFEWRKNGVPLTAGPTANGSTIVLNGASMQVLGAGRADEGEYDCVVSNACGSTTSWARDLIINGFCQLCEADFNGDGSVNSQDFFDFVAAFFGTGPSADFNHDGVVNSQDFFDFVSAFFVGCSL